MVASDRLRQLKALDDTKVGIKGHRWLIPGGEPRRRPPCRDASVGDLLVETLASVQQQLPVAGHQLTRHALPGDAGADAEGGPAVGGPGPPHRVPTRRGPCGGLPLLPGVPGVEPDAGHNQALSLLTVLLQDGVDVPPVPGELVDDLLQLVFNDRFKSVEHRVVVASARLSISYPAAYLPLPLYPDGRWEERTAARSPLAGVVVEVAAVPWPAGLREVEGRRQNGGGGGSAGGGGRGGAGGSPAGGGSSGGVAPERRKKNSAPAEGADGGVHQGLRANRPVDPPPRYRSVMMAKFLQGQGPRRRHKCALARFRLLLLSPSKLLDFLL
ncbi:hypothetical protein HU200_030246 [Digitaria exilis]|uniref:Isopenicillin N synthase-like Fe(2+) 2OG dioxygenase domain-containing protein n=1 Tax=Digitaria exilis TaxID=1010633 RepID=A0A835BSG5_9POAL|nr:hypothetical protein HU200_030246 [Digitaria exilis]